MLFLPVLQQILVPGFFSFLLMVASILPVQKNQTVHVIQHEQKKVVAAITPLVSTTPKPKHAVQKEVFSSQPHLVTVSPTVPPVSPVQSLPANSNGVINAKTTLSASGKTIHLAMSFPQSGGAISGTISGDCTGSVAGTFTQALSVISGTANAQCPMGFFSVPVTLSYTGSLVSSSQASVHYTVKAMGQTESGDTTLNLTQ